MNFGSTSKSMAMDLDFFQFSLFSWGQVGFGCH